VGGSFIDIICSLLICVTYLSTRLVICGAQNRIVYVTCCKMVSKHFEFEFMQHIYEVVHLMSYMVTIIVSIVVSPKR
jgi:hypothetical protein